MGLSVKIMPTLVTADVGLIEGIIDYSSLVFSPR
jgi:hypothetical protein